jgi:hypothetical protein
MRVSVEGKVYIYQKNLPEFFKGLNEFLDSWEI